MLLGLMLILRLFLTLLVFLNSSWVQVSDIAAWPYSVSILIRFTSFLFTLHRPSGSDDLGHFGVSFLELFDPSRAMGWSPVA